MAARLGLTRKAPMDHKPQRPSNNDNIVCFLLIDWQEFVKLQILRVDVLSSLLVVPLMLRSCN